MVFELVTKSSFVSRYLSFDRIPIFFLKGYGAFRQYDWSVAAKLCIRKKFPVLNMSWFSFARLQFWSRGKSRDQKDISDR